MKEPQIPVASEGYPFIIFTAFATLVIALLEYEFIALLLLALTGFVFSAGFLGYTSWQAITG